MLFGQRGEMRIATQYTDTRKLLLRKIEHFSELTLFWGYRNKLYALPIATILVQTLHLCFSGSEGQRVDARFSNGEILHISGSRLTSLCHKLH